MLLLLCLVFSQVNGQELTSNKTEPYFNVSEEIEQVIGRLTTLVNTKHPTLIADFHRERASGPKTYIKDPYNEVSKTLHLNSFSGNPQLIEKIILTIKLESYLKNLLEIESINLLTQDMERIENIIVLLQRTSNKVIDANPDTSTITTYTVLYDHPLNLSAFLKKGMDRGFWGSEILDLLKSHFF